MLIMGLGDIHWLVQKYGTLVAKEKCAFFRQRKEGLELRVYKYQDKYYIELWDEGSCILFYEKYD